MSCGARGHVAPFVPAKTPAVGLVPEPLLWLWESPPQQDISHSIKFFLCVWSLLSSMILILQDVWSYKRRISTWTLSHTKKSEERWRVEEIQPSLSYALSEWTEISYRISRTLISLVINSEIRCLSGDKNVKAILCAQGMGSFWSWKALKDSSSFSPSYFCLSEHKLLQPLPRLLVSETKPFPFRALQAPSTISFPLTCWVWTVSPEHSVLPTLPSPDMGNN